jgi:hypothetical protein
MRKEVVYVSRVVAGIWHGIHPDDSMPRMRGQRSTTRKRYGRIRRNGATNIISSLGICFVAATPFWKRVIISRLSCSRETPVVFGYRSANRDTETPWGHNDMTTVTMTVVEHAFWTLLRSRWYAHGEEPMIHARLDKEQRDHEIVQRSPKQKRFHVFHPNKSSSQASRIKIVCGFYMV